MTDMAVRKESLRTKISQSKIINRFKNYLIDEVFANVMIYLMKMRGFLEKIDSKCLGVSLIFYACNFLTIFFFLLLFLVTYILV